MNLLFVSDNLGIGGPQRQMVALARELCRRGHHIEFFCYAPQDALARELQAAEIPIHWNLRASRYDMGVFRGLRRQLKIGAYDSVVAFQPTPNLYAVIASNLVWPGPHVLISERFMDRPGHTRAREHLMRQFYRLGDWLTINSHHQRAYFEERYPWLRDRIKTIYNGVDLERFSPAREEPPDQPFKLLAVGRVVEYKNAACLVQALAILRNRYNIKLIVNWVGVHLTELAAVRHYIDQLNAEIVALNLTQQWHWLHERDDIPELLRQHHALVHPSYREGLPNAVCEAMACARPVLVSRILDHPRLVEEGRSGYLFDWDQPEELAGKIKRLYDLSAAERHAMGQRGRQFAEAHLSNQRMADEYEHLLHSLVQEEHQPQLEGR